MMEDSDYKKKCMTVVVPVFNRQSLIDRCLDSLFDQTWRPIEVIIVDNASTDKTVDKVNEWKNRKCNDRFSLKILSDSRRGAAFARQTGLEHTQTEKVMFFDSDDVMRQECVASAMAVWKRYPDVDVVAWPVAIHHNGEVRITHHIKGNIVERHLVHAVLRTQGYAIKTKFIKEAGGWRGEYPNWNDLETGTRILLANPRVYSLNEVLADVYHQKESITGERFSDQHGKWEKALGGIDDSISKCESASKPRLHNIVSYRRAVLAAHYAREGKSDIAIPLYTQAINEISKDKRPLIRFAYHWTRLGMRGAFSIVGKFL